MEVWEKVFLGDAEFLNTTHGQIACVLCHDGDRRSDDKETAHQGMIADPSTGGPSCVACHGDVVHVNDTNLHTTVAGMQNGLIDRGGSFENSPLSVAFENHCQSCHATCGSCHVSRPDSAGGGLVSDHNFKAPSMQNNCTACHGSRVGDEYLGNNEGVRGDLHWNQQGMSCNKCHGDELHGTPLDAENRYQNDLTVSCESDGCHDTTRSDYQDNLFHDKHINDFSCQVCHSVEYKSCYGCHVGKNDAGIPYFATDPSVMTFKIGLNPLLSKERPSKYVLLRHAPVAPDTFAYYGTDLLPDFDAVPTWKYATPHNIQLQTPQTESCNACHGNEDLFLTAKDVAAAEMAANQSVIVKNIPPALETDPAR